MALGRGSAQYSVVSLAPGLGRLLFQYVSSTRWVRRSTICDTTPGSPRVPIVIANVVNDVVEHGGGLCMHSIDYEHHPQRAQYVWLTLRDGYLSPLCASSEGWMARSR